MKNIFKSIISYILYRLGIIFNRKKINVLSLYFHNPSVGAFKKIVEWLVKRNYVFISADTLVLYIKGQKILNNKSVFISFDDGWQDNLKLMPIIKKYNIPVTFFVATEPLNSGNYWWEYAGICRGQRNINEFKGYSQDVFYSELSKLKSNYSLSRSSMTTSELVELSKHSLVDIQSHTHTHPILTNIDDPAVHNELKYSQELLCNLVDKPVDKFSYPNGSYGMREKDIVKQYYSCAFSTIQSYPKVGVDLYEIPRIALTDHYWSNLAKIVGTWQILKLFKKR